MRLILGSQSATRARVLTKWGYSFDVISPNIDEKAIRYKNPKRLVLALAHAKATAVLPRIGLKNGLVITSDQVVVCYGQILEKPVDEAEAREYFMRYRSCPAETVTSIVVTDLFSKERMHGVDRAKIWFRHIPPEVINWYIESGDPFHHAGGFDHEHPIISPYIDRIEGDPDSIAGLPKELTQRLISVFKY